MGIGGGMVFPTFRTGLGASAFGGVEKGAGAKILPLKVAVPWQVIDMPWDCKLMLNEMLNEMLNKMTLTALPANRRQSTATDHSREDSPAIKVNRYFNSSRYFNSRWNR
jgi:hypothetical protein